jgi:DNA processing protein
LFSPCNFHYLQETKHNTILNFTPQHQQIALTFLSGIGSRRARIIIAHFSDLAEFFAEKKLNLAKIPGISSQFVSHKQRIAALLEADKVLHYLDRIGAQTVFFTENGYPRRLKQCPDAPLLLYAKGNIDWNPEKVISIVGTRHASDYGKQLTQELIAGLAGTNTTIVSGMAYGIDICAHIAALQHQLPTIGVLGHGLDRLYPSAHQKTAGQMLESGGLISEFAPGMKPEPAYFPMRNRIVAGIADATIVVESGEKGGSLITANLANDYNRDVFAFPGDVSRPFSAGCLRLIQQNKAHLITNTDDVLRCMSWDAQPKSTVQRNLFVDLSPVEEKIVEALKTKKELAMDTIGYLTSLSAGEVAAHLLGLEFKGLVKALPGKRYSLI